MNKKQALAKFLDVKASELEKSTYDSSLFEHESREYLVLTDKQAGKRAEEYIEDSLWAFNTSWLMDYIDLPERAIDAIKEGYEDSGPAIKKLIGSSKKWQEFVSDSIRADGRGHFLSGYDGDENEEGEYFIYRVN